MVLIYQIKRAIERYKLRRKLHHTVKRYKILKIIIGTWKEIGK